jgi:glycosyltransferase involved in cell wall biosynthesis
VAVPEVTAAIAAYNAERYYTEAIDSLLNQTHRVLELLLVVDRASTDRTVAIAQGYAERDRACG